FAVARLCLESIVSLRSAHPTRLQMTSQRLSTPDAFAVCVAIASISAGERQSYGSRPSSFSLALTALMSSGLAPDSIIEETNAANPGGAQPSSDDSSVWMKSNPKNGCFSLSTRPYICTPHSLQAYRLIPALGSTTLNLSSFAVTRSLPCGTTATCENSAPAGFQHLVQPQTWLWAHWPSIATATFLSVQWQTSLPPAKFAAAGFVPWSTAGCMEIALLIISPSIYVTCHGTMYRV